MRNSILITLLLAGCVVGDEELPIDDDTTTLAAEWGPYDPMPGHPTIAERDSFVREISVYAREAERTYGVPAGAIIAMACNEGGFGWTKTAYQVNNLFGWKWYTPESAGGRPYWILEDQPEWDPNNRYVVFSSRRDAVLFVSSKLANSERYKPVTDRYRADLLAGVDVGTATNKWVYGIAYSGYNPYEHYPVTTIKFLYNYRDPSQTFSPVFNLYQYTKVQPFVTIDSPAAESTVRGDVTLSSSVGYTAVTKVKFFTRAVGATTWYPLGEDMTAPFVKTWPTAGWVANGLYDLRVEAWNGTTLRATGVTRVRVAN